MKPSRSFASDNNANIHPEVLEAIARANRGHVVGYGDDRYTVSAIEKFREPQPDVEDPLEAGQQHRGNQADDHQHHQQFDKRKACRRKRSARRRSVSASRRVRDR